MASVQSRIVKCDAILLTVGSNNVLALATDCSFRITTDLIDITAPKDTAKARRACQVDFEVQVGKLIATTQVFAATMLAKAQVVVSADAGIGSTFYGVALASNWEGAWEDPSKETLTLQCSNGVAPTVT